MTDERPEPWSTDVEDLYRNQARELWALFYAYCSDPDRAYDAVHEAFLRLHEHRGVPIENPRSWLLHVGRNWLRDVARRHRHAARPTERLDELRGSAHEPLQIVAENEMRLKIRGLLAQLKTDDREVLVLRYALGWSSSRIADVLNSTAAAVDMRLSRARRRLGDLLEESGIGHEPL